MSGAAFDTVVVPDFSGKASVTFEARTLYFLASWIELSRATAAFPLHLACIGEPPPSVRALAARAGARISLHAPAPASLGVYANKLRGFEAPLETGRILLLDVDILVLGDITQLAALIPDAAISAAPSHSAILLPEMWPALHARVGTPMPAHRIADFHRSLAIEGDAIYPSFNSGVVLAPAGSDLPAVWMEHLAALGELRPAWNEQLQPLGLSATDEPAFATAIYELQHRGTPFVGLPDVFNGRWRHLYRRAPRMADFVIFHMTSSFAYGGTLQEKLAPTAWGYQKKLLRRYGKRWLQKSASHARDAVSYLLPATWELRKLQPVLQRLHTKHVAPLVQEAR